MKSKNKRIRKSKVPISGIYLLRNKETNETYVGQSKDLNNRYKEHIYHNQSNIDKDIRKYGEENFDFIVLDLCDYSELDEKEDYYIRALESDKYGYNRIKGGQHNIGESNSNVKLTEQDVYNIREAYKNGLTVSDAYKPYKDKISISTFYNLWEGKYWTTIHMDVYENKNRLGNRGKPIKLNLSDDEVMRLRNMYVNMTSTEIYNTLEYECTYSNLKSILSGATYCHLPVYDKKNKKWINKN